MRANIPKGMGGGAPNMQSLLRQVQKTQEEVAAKQEELNARGYDISAGGGVVNVKINGQREILAIDLKPEIVDPDDIETLSDILVAVNRAYNKSDYIPCIAWGRNARYMENLEVGANIRLWGRVQSRVYQKRIGDEVEDRVAYEVSVSKIEFPERTEGAEAGQDAAGEETAAE